MVDLVNHPPHYQSETGIECIQAIEAALGREGFIAFLRGTVIKHLWRAAKKGDMPQDCAKAKWYLDRLNEVLGKEQVK